MPKRFFHGIVPVGAVVLLGRLWKNTVQFDCDVRVFISNSEATSFIPVLFFVWPGSNTVEQITQLHV